MFDLLALAYEADLTRVFTFMMAARSASGRIRTSASPSRITRSRTTQNKPERIAAHAKVNTYHIELFARFLERLRRRRTATGRCWTTR